MIKQCKNTLPIGFITCIITPSLELFFLIDTLCSNLLLVFILKYSFDWVMLLRMLLISTLKPLHCQPVFIHFSYPWLFVIVLLGSNVCSFLICLCMIFWNFLILKFGKSILKNLVLMTLPWLWLQSPLLTESLVNNVWCAILLSIVLTLVQKFWTLIQLHGMWFFPVYWRLIVLHLMFLKVLLTFPNGPVHNMFMLFFLMMGNHHLMKWLLILLLLNLMTCYLQKLKIIQIFSRPISNFSHSFWWRPYPQLVWGRNWM